MSETVINRINLGRVAAPTISVSSHTLDADSEADITIIEDTNLNTMHLDFGIPKGKDADLETMNFDDTKITSSNATLADAIVECNDAISNIKTDTLLTSILSYIKKGISAARQGLSVLYGRVGSIKNITINTHATETGYALDATVINEYVVTETVYNTSELTLSNTSGNASITITPPTKTGYKVIGAVGYGTGSGFLFPWRVFIINNNDGSIRGVMNIRSVYTGNNNGEITIPVDSAFITFLYIKQ